MDKMTFKQYLIELDVGDLELARQKRDQQVAAAGDQRARDQFGQQMTSNNPSEGDIIQSNGKRYVVTDMLRDGIHVRQLGGERTPDVIQHGTKFKPVGKMPSGKPVFEIIS